MPKYIVRYGTMRSLGVMTARNEAVYRRGMEVIVRSDRGVEVGQVLCEATDDALSHLDHPPAGSIVRPMSDDDASKLGEIDLARKAKIDACQRHVDSLQMKMKLVDVELLLGGERMVVYYIADERVDFRELVRLLATEFKTRIEMRQIGVRDEAKILADYGDCGKPVCCNNHLTTMPPVSMRMAKLQKATLDPTKISGRCGRLKCCLRYEYDSYDEIQKQLPRVGAFVLTRDGKAKVLGQRILAEQLLVESEDHRRMVIDASEVLSVIKPSSGQANKSDGDRKPESERGREGRGGRRTENKGGRANRSKNYAGSESPNRGKDRPSREDRPGSATVDADADEKISQSILPAVCHAAIRPLGMRRSMKRVARDLQREKSVVVDRDAGGAIVTKSGLRKMRNSQDCDCNPAKVEQLQLEL